MKKILLVLTLLTIPHAVSAQGNVYLRQVDGYDGMGLLANTWVTFHIGISNQTLSNIVGLTHGFVFYSPDGAVWTGLDGEWAPAVQPMCDLVHSVSVYGDTVGFGCATLLGGIPAGFDGDAMLIHLWITFTEIGKTVCFDSAFFPPGGNWLWSTTSGDYSPDWDGPHCFEVTNYTWLCGDIDNNGTITDVSDLTFLVDYLFGGGPAPQFPFSPDLNGDMQVNIEDLTYMVEYMFNGGPAPICFKK